MTATCPTCGRAPSERISLEYSRLQPRECDDPIHDLADHAPEAFEALRKIMAQACRPHYGSDGKKLDDVHEDACPACIARTALRGAL